jgi:S-adenosylmethionine synthetase
MNGPSIPLVKRVIRSASARDGRRPAGPRSSASPPRTNRGEVRRRDGAALPGLLDGAAAPGPVSRLIGPIRRAAARLDTLRSSGHMVPALPGETSMQKDFLFTSESVTEGHPDKMADRISDAVLDAVLARDPQRPGGLRDLAQDRLRDRSPANHHQGPAWTYPAAGPRGRRATSATRAGDMGFDGHTCAVLVAVDQQSPGHRAGRGHGRGRRPGDDVRLRLRRDAESSCRRPSSTPTTSPARARQARGAAAWTSSAPGRQGAGDASSTGTARPARIDTVVVSTQHADGRLASKRLARRGAQRSSPGRCRAELARSRRPRSSSTRPAASSSAARMGDTGVTGRKIIVDTYGGMRPARRRRVLGQGPLQGRPLGRLHGALRRQERGRRRAGRAAARSSWPTPSAWPSRCR